MKRLVDCMVGDGGLVCGGVWSGRGKMEIRLKDMKEGEYREMEVGEEIWKGMGRDRKGG